VRTTSYMPENVLSEFPFVEGLPKLEKSKLQRLWDHFSEIRQITREKGVLIPQAMAAEMGGVSSQRIDQLCLAGRLHRVRVFNRPFVTETSLLAWATSERANGAHVEIRKLTREDAWRISKALQLERKV